MCAAPGGKTTMLAQMMAGDSSSEILALDRTGAKAARVQQLADSWGVGGLVKVMAADATQLYQKDRSEMPVDLQEQQAETPSNDGVVDLQQRQQQQQETIDQDADSSDSNNRVRKKRRTDKGTEPQAAALLQQQQQQQLAELLAAAQPESFEAVLLDAPCSALGLRPRLLLDWKLPQLQALAAYQRALLHAAVHMLKPGGSLVYCTCTINPGGLFRSATLCAVPVKLEVILLNREKSAAGTCRHAPD
jgi:16S rRNA C967 or C1407 C5-methylase (RsmB/RsmF family)